MRAIPLDFRHLQEITAGDRLFLRELVDDFLQLGDEMLLKMGDLADRNDFDELKTTAHALKGSSLSIGSVELGALAAQLEENCKGQNHDSVLTLINQSRAEFTRISNWWRRGSEDYAT